MIVLSFCSTELSGPPTDDILFIVLKIGNYIARYGTNGREDG